ncbi:tetratricopeptide repeat protein [Kitasatospora putterlickiae]|uniref:Tetratricopeptide repeat protein n=1 Tax=Kitasatospora putterlickiae TaxID=221725 RepID=A0ABN1YDI8_9ACTN
MSTQSKEADLSEVARLRGEERFEEARTRLLELSARFPDDAEIAYITASVHDRMGLEAEAVAFYERSLTTTGLSEEDHRGALLGLGSTYRVLGRYPEAVDTLRAGVQRHPNDGALRTFLGMALFNVGDHHGAMSLLLDLLATTSEDPDVRRYRRAIEYYAKDLHHTA